MPRPVRIQPNLDSVTSINDDGSRNFLRPADVKGRYTRARRFVAALLLLGFAALPWIQVKGYPALLFDITHQRIHLFGLSFVTQDLWISFFFLTGLGFLLFFITALLGRVWCGWTCPQTLFMEHVYRRVERLFEGDSAQQKALDQMPWCPEKCFRRGAKHLAFVLISFSVAHLVLAWFVPVGDLLKWMTGNPFQHWGPFVFIVVTTGLLYFNFAWFREQLCIFLCPYGRLQSTLIDDDSLIIGYDDLRGEPRGKPSDPANGDCIDCFRCVQVCPTGIDIRQGLQMECIGCANCIDACDSVMLRLKRPTGLIRYDSLNGFAGKPRRILRPRILIYSVFLLVGTTVMALSLGELRATHLSITRMSGPPFFRSETHIRNQFSLRLVNKSSSELTLLVALNATHPDLTQQSLLQPLTLAPLEERILPLIVSLETSSFASPFDFEVWLSPPDEAPMLKRELRFLGPDLSASKRTLVFE